MSLGDPIFGPFGLAGCQVGAQMAQMQNVNTAHQAAHSAQQNYYAQNNIGLYVDRWAPPAEPRFRSIDPKSKLSQKAARLLKANHVLVQS